MHAAQTQKQVEEEELGANKKMFTDVQKLRERANKLKKQSEDFIDAGIGQHCLSKIEALRALQKETAALLQKADA